MAAVPDPPLVPVDEYLNGSCSQDSEYVGGLLVERSPRTGLQSLFHALLAEYFRMYRKQFKFGVYARARTQIVERARYRLPDIMLAPLPAVPDKVITKMPWVVIEIQSPEDKAKQQWHRFQDYLSIGVPHVILLDPEESLAFRCERRALIETSFTDLELPTGRLPFDSTALFQQLADELNES